MANIKVYYNSACPVCKRGIENQQCRMTAHGIDDVEWLDVHTHPERVTDIGADLEFIRERLHVKDEHGSIHIGSDAMATLFARTPRQRWLARLLHAPVIGPLANRSYNGFARWLYCWNRARGHW